MDIIEVYIEFKDMNDALIQATTLENCLGCIYEVVFLIPKKIYNQYTKYFHTNIESNQPETMLGRRFVVIDDRLLVNK